jgi:hypothetical protein
MLPLVTTLSKRGLIIEGKQTSTASINQHEATGGTSNSIPKEK